MRPGSGAEAPPPAAAAALQGTCRRRGALQVTAGTRFAITIAYTCDRRAAIEDFLGRAAPDREEGDGAAAAASGGEAGASTA